MVSAETLEDFAELRKRVDRLRREYGCFVNIQSIREIVMVQRRNIDLKPDLENLARMERYLCGEIPKEEVFSETKKISRDEEL